MTIASGREINSWRDGGCHGLKHSANICSKATDVGVCLVILAEGVQSCPILLMPLCILFRSRGNLPPVDQEMLLKFWQGRSDLGGQITRRGGNAG